MMNESNEKSQTPWSAGERAVADELAKLACDPLKPVGGETALKERLRSRLAEQGVRRKDASPLALSSTLESKTERSWFAISVTPSHWRMAALFVIGLLLGLMAAQTFYSIPAPSPPHHSSNHLTNHVKPAQEHPNAVPSAEALKTQLAAFEQVSDFLNQRAAWLAVSSDIQDIGVSDRTLSPEFLTQIRVTAMQDDQTVSTTDILLVPGEPAQLVAPLHHGRQVVYTLMIDPERRDLSFSVRVENARNPSQSASIGTVVPLGKQSIIPAGQVQLGESSYRLLLGYTIIDPSSLYPAGSVQ